MSDPSISFLELGELRLRTAQWGSGQAEIVMLHDGLGSIDQWRSVPSEVATVTGKSVVAYERAGHGQSQPVPTGPWPADWLDREATVLEQVVAAVAAPSPILVGHSDGGSAALLFAARRSQAAASVLALAAHSFVEEVCLDAIHAMRANAPAITSGLSRHHEAPAAIFEAWSGGWVSPEFRDWDIRPAIGAIDVPTLIAQGALDAYASEAHAYLTAEAIGANARAEIIPDVGHIMHHDDAGVVVSLIARFVAEEIERGVS